jgi:hypothetical protein
VLAVTRSPEVEVPFEGDDIVNDYIAKYSNWGRWGADDELGTMNHVGAEQVVAAAQLVRQGKVISLTELLGASLLQSGVCPSGVSWGVAGRSEWSGLSVDVLVDVRQRRTCAGDGEVGRRPEVAGHAGADTHRRTRAGPGKRCGL